MMKYLCGKSRDVAGGAPIVSTMVVLDEKTRWLWRAIGPMLEIEADAVQRVEHGLPPGRIESVGDTLRRKTYASMLAAGVDYRIGLLEDREDPRAAEARRLEPLAWRAALLREYRELQVAPALQNAVERHDSARPDSAPPANEPWSEIDENVDPFVRNLLETRRATADVLRANREARIAAYEQREADRVRDLMADPQSVATERARIELALRRWNDKHMDLVDELVAEAGRGR